MKKIGKGLFEFLRDVLFLFTLYLGIICVVAYYEMDGDNFVRILWLIPITVWGIWVREMLYANKRKIREIGERTYPVKTVRESNVKTPKSYFRHVISSDSLMGLYTPQITKSYVETLREINNIPANAEIRIETRPDLDGGAELLFEWDKR